ncbi:MAG: spore germination protein [Bacillaceae bacterium]|nr:spore germination protein [Bacillaceae bacterium]
MRKWKTSKKEKKSATPEKNKPDIITKEQLEYVFENCQDIKSFEMDFERTEKKPVNVIFFYNEGMSDVEKLNEKVIPRLELFFEKISDRRFDEHALLDYLHISSLRIEKDLDQIIPKVFDGELLFFIPDLNTAYSINLSKQPQRNPEEPNTEISIRGPRDGFIEEIEVNVALVRKRLRTNSFRYEQFVIGDRTKTRVGLLYIEDIARKDMIDHIREKISTIKIDAITSSNQIEELLVETPLRLFPMFKYTGRPDYVADVLIKGHFAIIIDGTPTALIAPVNLIKIMKSPEDQDTIYIYSSLGRVFRIFGITAATFLPGLWVAMVTYHPEQVPFILLSGIAESRQGVPFPLPISALLMVLAFELFREAGLRLPGPVGQVLGVVGGIIIGESAIRAGFTTPAMVVVIATSLVATFALTNQSLEGVISILRLGVLLLSSFLGLFGLLIAFYMILAYVANLRSFGIPYLAPLAPYRLSDLTDAIFRKPLKADKKRPEILHTQDQDKQEDNQ